MRTQLAAGLNLLLLSSVALAQGVEKPKPPVMELRIEVQTEGKTQFVVFPKGAAEVSGLKLRYVTKDQTMFLEVPKGVMTYSASKVTAKPKVLQLSGKAWFGVKQDQQAAQPFITAESMRIEYK